MEKDGPDTLTIEPDVDSAPLPAASAAKRDSARRRGVAALAGTQYKHARAKRALLRATHCGRRVKTCATVALSIAVEALLHAACKAAARSRSARDRSSDGNGKLGAVDFLQGANECPVLGSTSFRACLATPLAPRQLNAELCK
jgi:hypothetical protein